MPTKTVVFSPEEVATLVLEAAGVEKATVRFVMSSKDTISDIVAKGGNVAVTFEKIVVEIKE